MTSPEQGHPAPAPGPPPVPPPAPDPGPPGPPHHAPPAADPDATALLPVIGVDPWAPAVPAEPFHARHEKPGEWRHTPPEHLAFEHSPPAELREPGWDLLPVSGAPAPATPRRRRRIWLGAALGVTLLLCAGGAVSGAMLLRGADRGAPDPAAAVDRFLTAVYLRRDASAADALVCREARDAAGLRRRVEQVTAYAAAYEQPDFRWAAPAVSARGADRATVAVRLKLTTADERVAEQPLSFTVVRRTGWVVCEIGRGA